jgi:hypothetical protein
MKISTSNQQWVAWPTGALEVLLSMALSVWLLTLPSVFGVYYPALAGISFHTRDAEAVVRWLTTSYRERSLYLAVTDRRLGQ